MPGLVTARVRLLPLLAATLLVAGAYWMCMSTVSRLPGVGDWRAYVIEPIAGLIGGAALARAFPTSMRRHAVAGALVWIGILSLVLIAGGPPVWRPGRSSLPLAEGAALALLCATGAWVGVLWSERRASGTPRATFWCALAIIMTMGGAEIARVGLFAFLGMEHAAGIGFVLMVVAPAVAAFITQLRMGRRAVRLAASGALAFPLMMLDRAHYFDHRPVAVLIVLMVFSFAIAWVAGWAGAVIGWQFHRGDQTELPSARVIDRDDDQ